MTLIVFGALVVLPLVWAVVNFNRMVCAGQHMRESWSDIDVEMKRRYELIPNLVATVKGYAAHERAVLDEVIALRNKAMSNHGRANEQAVDETALQIGMRRLFAVVESYPQLRADTHFLGLQQELANTEDRIAAARRFYNGNVREMNQLCEAFPTNLLAAAVGFRVQDYFELNSDVERIVPRVK